MPLAFCSLALVESSQLRRTTQAREGRLVEDTLENLVATSHPTVVTYPLAGGMSRRDETCVGGEPVGARESAEVSHGHQELSPEDRSHARQASENPSLGAGEKTLT